jgi:hypothetical protein
VTRIGLFGWTLLRAQRPGTSGNGGLTVSNFQMPVPILGYRADVVSPILVIGLNTGYDSAEQGSPLYSEDGLAAYLDWCRNVLATRARNANGKTVKFVGGRARVIRHYSHVESRLQRSYPGIQIGRGAVYADMVPWRSKDGSTVAAALKNTDAQRWVEQHLEKIVQAVYPQKVVLLGQAVAQVARLSWKPLESTPQSWLGRNAWTVYHPNAFGNPAWPAI